MTTSPSARPAARRARPSAATVSTQRITVYGCGRDEAAMFDELAPRLRVVPATTEAALGEDNVGLALGSRCVSVGHKTPVTSATLLALSRVGVTYVSTRSVGCDHIDVAYASSVGIVVEPVAYSPDSVADYTLMLMLMAVRHVKSVLRRADAHDFRLSDGRGRELRDLTVGVVGTGRIGAAVIGRLHGFGCRVLAYDLRPTTLAEHVALDDLLRRSDIVRVLTRVSAQTHHLLDRRRIRQLRPGAVVINTGRGALLDTEALVGALERGRLGGAALDVVEGEEGIFYADCRDRPVGGTLLGRLQEMPNVIVTPHTAYYTDHALRDTVENSIVNCLRHESGARHG